MFILVHANRLGYVQAGVEEDDFIWGCTEEIVDGPRGCKATVRGGVREGDVPPPV